jgi:Tfp pilus assembly protein PilV
LAEVRRVHQAEVQLQLLVTLLYRRMRDEEATRRIHAHESKQVLYSFNCWPQMAVKDQRIAKLEEEAAAAEAERWQKEKEVKEMMRWEMEAADEEIRDAHAQYGGTYHTGHSEYDSESPE